MLVAGRLRGNCLRHEGAGGFGKMGSSNRHWGLELQRLEMRYLLP